MSRHRDAKQLEGVERISYDLGDGPSEDHGRIQWVVAALPRIVSQSIPTLTSVVGQAKSKGLPLDSVRPQRGPRTVY